MIKLNKVLSDAIPKPKNDIQRRIDEILKMLEWLIDNGPDEVSERAREAWEKLADKPYPKPRRKPAIPEEPVQKKNPKEKPKPGPGM